METRTRKGMSHWPAVIALVAGLSLAPPPIHAAKGDAPPQSVVVARGLLRVVVRVPGVIVAGTDVDVAPRAPGEIISIPVKVGQAVKKGQVLLEVDASETTRAVNRALADLYEAQARLRIAQLRLESHEQEYKEAGETAGLTGERPRDLTELTTYALELERQEVLLRSAEFNRARNAAADARAALANTKLLAPIDGVVTAVNVDPGETITRAAIERGAPVVTVSNLTRVAVQAEIDQSQVLDLQPNLAATITIPAFPNRTFQGSIDTISPCGLKRENAVFFPIRIDLKGDAGDAGRPGLTATAEIVAIEKPNVLLLDKRALRAVGNEVRVTLLDDGKPKDVPVKIGRGDGERYEVLEGLREGDRVVAP